MVCEIKFFVTFLADLCLNSKKDKGGLSVELDALYQEYAKLLYHFIYLKCHDRALAEDIVQSTFLKAILQIDSFQGKSKISTWLCEIARNEYLNYCRKHERQQSCDEYVQKSGERPLKQEGFFRDAVLESMIVKEQADMIKRVVHTLKEPYKEVFLLRVYGECSFGEIAELFQKSDTWARVTYYRAKTKIIEEFEEKGALMKCMIFCWTDTGCRMKNQASSV